jgi:MOSC domain
MRSGSRYAGTILTDPRRAASSLMIERYLGNVVAVAADRGHHFSKPLRDSIDLVQGLGIEGDAHAGPHVRHRYLARRRPRLPNLRQVHLIPVEIFAELRTAGYDVGPGELGENITVAGLELERLPLGTVIRLGMTAAVELTGLRTPCVLIDRFQPGLKSRMIREDIRGPKFKCGVVGVVRIGGRVSPGNAAWAELPDGPQQPLPNL